MTSIMNALAKSVASEALGVLSRTANSVSAAFDVTLYDGTIVFILAAGAATAGTNPTLDVKLTHCDTSGGTYVDVTGATFAQVTTVSGVQKLAVDSDRLKQFVKVSWTIGGTVSPAFTFGVVAEGMKKYA